MEEKRVVICPEVEEGIIAYEEQTIVHGQINVAHIAEVGKRIEEIRLLIEAKGAELKTLETEYDFGMQIINAKRAEDERVAEEARVAAEEELAAMPEEECCEEVCEECVEQPAEEAPVQEPLFHEDYVG